jgi:hypothetical protein
MSSVGIKRLFLVVAFLLPSLAFAQGGTSTPVISSPEPLPNCAAPALGQPTYIISDLTAGILKWCSALNTWTALASGGSGTISGQTIGCLPLANSATSSTSSSKVCDNGTTLTYSGAGGLAANASTATTLAATPTQCGGGTPIATGIAANGNANCTAAGAGFANPMTTLGDIIYENASPAATRLAGPTVTANVPQTLISTPSGAATAPVWAPAGVPTNAQTGTTYTVAATDRASYVTFSNAGAIAVTLPQAGTSGFFSNFVFVACDIGAGTATITPTTSTISFTTGAAYTSAASSMALTTGQCAWIYSDNTNYFSIRR